MTTPAANKFLEERRAKAIAVMADPNVALAMSIANSRIEGLEPTAASIEDEKRVIRGEITGDELRQEWLSELDSRSK